MTDTGKEWVECAALCQFLAERGESLSKETRILIEYRLAAIVGHLCDLDNPPQPF